MRLAIIALASCALVMAQAPQPGNQLGATGGGGGSGTVTAVSGLTPLFTVATPNTTPTFSLITKPLWTFYGNDTNGTAAPNFYNLSALADGTTITFDTGTGKFSAVGGGGGGVTSVGLTTPSWLTVGGSPVTTSGTLAITATTAQTSHQVIGTCGAGTTFLPCSLVLGDFPTIANNTILGNNSGSTGVPLALTVAQLNAVLGTVPATASTFGVFKPDNSTITCSAGVCSATTGGGGTVTSVAQTVPSWLSVSGSPVTVSGTLGITAATGQTSHEVIGTCGAATSVALCALVAGDLPAVPLSGLSTQATNTVVMNATGSTAVPTAVAMPTCTSGADLYNTTTHSWSCVSTGSGGTTINTTGQGASIFGGSPATLYTNYIPRAVSGTTDSLTTADCSNVVSYSNASLVSITVPAVSTMVSSQSDGCPLKVISTGAAGLSLTVTGGATIGGNATFTLAGGTVAGPSVLEIGTNQTNSNYDVISQIASASAGGANTALSNLASVAINTSLLFASAQSLGSTSAPPQNLFLYGGGTFGTDSFEITGTSTANRTWTLQDSSDTFVGRATTDTLTNKSIAATEVNSGTLAQARGGTGVSNTATLTLGTSNQNWATLGTGIVKNTTTTGALSDAASADVIGLWTGTCNSSTFLRGDGACAAGGSGASLSASNAWTTSAAASTAAQIMTGTAYKAGSTTTNSPLILWQPTSTTAVTYSDTNGDYLVENLPSTAFANSGRFLTMAVDGVPRMQATITSNGTKFTDPSIGNYLDLNNFNNIGIFANSGQTSIVASSGEVAMTVANVNTITVDNTGIQTLLGYEYECTHGTNGTCGVATLASGTVTVSTSKAATKATSGGAGAVYSLTLQSCSTCGILSVGTVTNGTSFVINSTNASDASLVFWEIKKVL